RRGEAGGGRRRCPPAPRDGAAGGARQGPRVLSRSGGEGRLSRPPGHLEDNPPTRGVRAGPGLRPRLPPGRPLPPGAPGPGRADGDRLVATRQPAHIAPRPGGPARDPGRRPGNAAARPRRVPTPRRRAGLTLPGLGRPATMATGGTVYRRPWDVRWR